MGCKKSKLLIKNATIVNDDEIVVSDIYIKNGIIKQIQRNIKVSCCVRKIDACGRYVMPGGIDPHTHFKFQFMNEITVDDFYIGTRAAVAGGTTFVIDLVFPREGQSLIQAYHEWRKEADRNVCCDYGLHMGLTSWSDCIRKDMKILCQQYGINSFKSCMQLDNELQSMFEACKANGAIAEVPSENEGTIKKNAVKLLAEGVTGLEGHEMARPEDSEGEEVARACVIANKIRCPIYVVHIMSKSAAEALAEARQKSSLVYGETSPAALATDGRHYKHGCWYHAAAYVLSPPLRSDPSTPKFLMTSLAEDKLQLTASHNCTFNKIQKSLGVNNFTKIPNGVNGVEDRMSIVWEKGVHSGLMDPRRFVAVTSSNAAKIFNLYPKKGCIKVGSDADIIIWNADKTRIISAQTHHHGLDFNIFEGMECHGVPEFVIVRGRVCVDNYQLKAVKGHGRYVQTFPYSPYVYH